VVVHVLYKHKPQTPNPSSSKSGEREREKERERETLTQLQDYTRRVTQKVQVGYLRDQGKW
jgi:hypothetical protein